MSIPVFERRIGLVDMIAYAGATWDWHRLHYDPAFLAEKNLPGPVVDGQMLGALMAEQLLDHFGPDAFLSALSIRYRAMMFAEETVRIEATVATPSTNEATCTLRATVGDRVVAEGEARVQLGARHG